MASGDQPIRASALFTFLRGSNGELVMEYLLGALATGAAALVYIIRRRRRLSMIRDVPGPMNPSWIFGTSHGVTLIPFTSSSRSAEFENLQGHQWYLQAEEAGGTEKRFREDFGNVVHWNGPLGVHLTSHHIYPVFELLVEMIGMCVQEDRLWIADPKAINHILQKSGYLYAKPSNARERIALLGDGGVASVEGKFFLTNNHFLLWLV